MTTNWDKMMPEQKLTAATVDIMQQKEFCRLSGIVTMGNRKVVDTILDAIFEEIGKELPFPLPPTFTAATNGEHCWYGRKFMEQQDRLQHRWIVLHENFHKGLHHCTEYREIVEVHPQLSNMAQDFCINGMIYQLDPQELFAKRPAGIEVCFDPKYFGWGWIEILKDLLKDQKKGKGGGGKGTCKGGGVPGGNGAGGKQVVFDVHIPNRNTAKKGQEAKDALEAIKRQVDDGMFQGKIIHERMAGKGGGNAALDNLTRKRDTNWKPHIRNFFEQIVAGYEYSRFNPPNRRFLPLDILMPSHFEESTGEIHLYCDTSGSMGGVYPVVFGEIARIAEQMKPSKLRVIWWDGEVQGEQEFTIKDYDQIATLMKPRGGGGTTPSCVVHYVKEKGYKPKCGVWLTDGYLDGSDATLPFPVLWGVVDNEGFVPPQGQKVNIPSGV